ncbi:hypothetical protein [Methanosarcina horonobensis]|nr:hypothetical protein [Methanosarcina horonobensis]
MVRETKNLDKENKNREIPKLPEEEPIRSIWIQKGGSNNDRKNNKEK